MTAEAREARMSGDEQDALSLLLGLKYTCVSPDAPSTSSNTKNDITSVPSLTSSSSSFEQTPVPGSSPSAAPCNEIKPFPLTAPEDGQYLTHVECLVRSKCCEYVVCPDTALDGESSLSSRDGSTSSYHNHNNSNNNSNTPVNTSNNSSSSLSVSSQQEASSIPSSPGRVGIQCRFCNHLPPSSRTPNSTLYPETLHDIYTSVNQMIGNHLLSCPCVPPPLKKTLSSAQTLMSRNFRSEFDNAGTSRMSQFQNQQPYWVESAKALGLVEREGCKKGIYLDGPSQEYSVNAVRGPTPRISSHNARSCSIGSASSNMTTHGHTQYNEYNRHRSNSNATTTTTTSSSSSSSSTSRIPTTKDHKKHSQTQRKPLPLRRLAQHLPTKSSSQRHSSPLSSSNHSNTILPHHNTSSKPRNNTHNNLTSLPPQEATPEEIAPFMGETSLVSLTDKDLVPDFLFLSMAQMKPCKLTSSDRVGCYKDRPVGFIGMCCKHCGGQPGFGKFFPATVRSLAQTTTSQTIVKHVSTKCRFAPLNVRRKVIQLQEEQVQREKSLKSSKETETRPKYGSRKIFFERVWERLHGNGDENGLEGGIPAPALEGGKKRKNKGPSSSTTITGETTSSVSSSQTKGGVSSGRLVSPHDTDASGNEEEVVMVSSSSSSTPVELEQRQDRNIPSHSAYMRMNRLNNQHGVYRQESTPPPPLSSTTLHSIPTHGPPPHIHSNAHLLPHHHHYPATTMARHSGDKRARILSFEEEQQQQRQRQSKNGLLNKRSRIISS